MDLRSRKRIILNALNEAGSDRILQDVPDNDPRIFVCSQESIVAVSLKWPLSERLLEMETGLLLGEADVPLSVGVA